METLLQVFQETERINGGRVISDGASASKPSLSHSFLRRSLANTIDAVLHELCWQSSYNAANAAILSYSAASAMFGGSISCGVRCSG